MTITKVGYGDIVPYTYIGWILGSLTAFIGVFIIVVPITIIAYNL